MKLHILSKLGITMGIFVTLTSTVRWFFIFPDNSNLVFGVGLGGGIVLMYLLYNWIRNVEEAFKDTHKRMDSMYKWFEKKEWEQ